MRDVEVELSEVAARQFWLVDFAGSATAEAWADIQGATSMKAKNGSVLRSWGVGDTWAEQQDDLDQFYDTRNLGRRSSAPRSPAAAAAPGSRSPAVASRPLARTAALS